MKLYICADMEGATGIVHRDQLLDEGGARYVAGCKLLTADINAAIEGAVAAGFDEAVISEGHAHMRNVVLEDLHPAARLIRGPATFVNKPLCQVAGLDESFDLAFFVGFHSRAGTPKGLLSHTWAGAIVHEITVNGVVFGETAINAAICGTFGVPVGLVCGADDVAREARADLGDVEVAVTKKAMGFNIAECWGPAATRVRITEAARRAATRHQGGAFKPFTVGTPVVAELETHRREMADRMGVVPGLERVGPRRVRAVAERPADALSMLWHAVTEAFHEPAGWLK
ncbi:MAG: M55 family metallopeptidase [Pseudomonadota bacterium]|nr:M55 family metallopeptidase [Pseudomonadota bacterium]